MTPEKLYDALTKYAASRGQELNADKAHVMQLMEGLLRNEARYGYRSCPCRLSSGDREKDKDIVCPCAYKDPDVSEYSRCYCGLYVTHDYNTGKAQHAHVPERRPNAT